MPKQGYKSTLLHMFSLENSCMVEGCGSYRAKLPSTQDFILATFPDTGCCCQGEQAAEALLLVGGSSTKPRWIVGPAAAELIRVSWVTAVQGQKMKLSQILSHASIAAAVAWLEMTMIVLHVLSAAFQPCSTIHMA